MKKEYIILLLLAGIALLIYGGEKVIKVINMKTFLQKFYPLAAVASRAFGFPNPYFLLSQMYAENSGKSFLLDTANNVGSLVSRSTPTRKLPTNNWWHGEETAPSPVGLYFRKYRTLQDGFMDYAHTLAVYYHLNQAKDINAYANAISNSAYLDIKNGDNRQQYANNIITTYSALVNSKA